MNSIRKKLSRWIDENQPNIQMSDEDKNLLWGLHQCGIATDEIAMAMDKSEQRIRYEIKQLEQKRGKE